MTYSFIVYTMPTRSEKGFLTTDRNLNSFVGSNLDFLSLQGFWNGKDGKGGFSLSVNLKRKWRGIECVFL